MEPARTEFLARAAAVGYVFLGLAFGLSVPVVLAFYAVNGYLPTVASFRALGGPFESLGASGFTAAGWLLVAVSAVDVVSGLLVWRGRRVGMRLALLTDPIAFVLGIGFALPLLLIGVPLRAALLLAAALGGQGGRAGRGSTSTRSLT